MIRIGALHYSNALPFFYPLSTGKVAYPGTLIWGTPSEINLLLAKGEVDIAMISSLSYLDRRDECVLLSDLGIAASESVMSVCLFNPKGVDPSTFKEILLTNESESSARLLKVLCLHFWRIRPVFTSTFLTAKELVKQKKPFLMIGDSCLETLSHPGFTSVDLAKAWHMATHKSFVFALLATNNFSLQTKSNEIFDFHKSIHEAFLWSEKNYDEIVDYAFRKMPQCPKKKIIEYYQFSLEYKLSSKHFQGLEFFSQIEKAPVVTL